MPGGHVHLELALGRACARGRGSSRQGCLGTRPSPWQTSQTTVRTICPNGVRVTACSCPAPPQRSQVSIGVPGSAPLPWQCSQRSTASIGDLHRRAVGGLEQVDLDRDRDVAALARARAPAERRRRRRTR